MSGQSAVGFGFQADIVSTASVGHLLTGRILKAMSDGGVDVYAVAAAVELGKLIPVRTSLERTVRTHLMSRRSFTSVLNMALRIGWGHSVVAIEMTRTRAGTNALLLIGALTAGHYPEFRAAQCLSELMSLYGCEADRLPNVDLLKGLVAYLAPFTSDLGFSKVLEHITLVAERAMRSRGGEETTLSAVPYQLSDLGGAPMLAGAIKQLILTAGSGERMYMILNKHGSWLPAFASHILGMEVELRYTRMRSRLDSKGKDGMPVYGDTRLDASGHTRSKNGDSQKEEDEDNNEDDPVIWACAGDKGSVIFELEGADRKLVPLFRSTGPNIEIVDGDRVADLDIDHTLQDALAHQLSRRPEIDEELAEGIHNAIARLSWTLFQYILMKVDHLKEGHPINSHFDQLAALKETLGSIGLPEPSIRITALPFSRNAPGNTDFWSEVLTYLDPRTLESLKIISKCHHAVPLHPKERERAVYTYVIVEIPSAEHIDTGNCIPGQCLYGFVARIILNFASSAVALMQCRFDASQLRVSGRLLSGLGDLHWVSKCGSIITKTGSKHTDSVITFSYDDLLVYLDHLVAGNSKGRDWEPAGMTLGFSNSTQTVYYTALMQQEPYDAYGRVISVVPGRASYNGNLRNTICQSSMVEWSSPRPGAEGSFALAAGCFVEPHGAPSAMEAFLHATLDEHSITVTFEVGHGAIHDYKVHFHNCLESFRTLWRVPKCRHDRNTPFRVKEGMNLTLMGFYQDYVPGPAGKSEVAIIAVRGNKLHQMLTCELSPWGKSHFDATILQLEACLECCIEHAKRDGPKSCIIMGG